MSASRKSKKPKWEPPPTPLRDPDHVSKRGVNYWWSPEWVRCNDSSNTTYGRIRAIKEKGTVNLYAKSKAGKLNYIQGSIQQEFKDWHEQRKIDYFFIADSPEDLDDFILQADESE